MSDAVNGKCLWLLPLVIGGGEQKLTCLPMRGGLIWARDAGLDAGPLKGNEAPTAAVVLSRFLSLCVSLLSRCTSDKQNVKSGLQERAMESARWAALSPNVWSLTFWDWRHNGVVVLLLCRSFLPDSWVCSQNKVIIGIKCWLSQQETE
jgi:hypothetical protein